MTVLKRVVTVVIPLVAVVGLLLVAAFGRGIGTVLSDSMERWWAETRGTNDIDLLLEMLAENEEQLDEEAKKRTADWLTEVFGQDFANLGGVEGIDVGPGRRITVQLTTPEIDVFTDDMLRTLTAINRDRLCSSGGLRSFLLRGVTVAHTYTGGDGKWTRTTETTGPDCANIWIDLGDDFSAFRWYQLAAEQGDAFAQMSVGNMYLEGLGVSQDETEEVYWYGLSADQGNARAQGQLGYIYMNGLGVPQDSVQAHMWLNLSASRSTGQFCDSAVLLRDDITTRMTGDQIAEAQRRAREWTPTSEP